jgi:hypothetical protein
MLYIFCGAWCVVIVLIVVIYLLVRNDSDHDGDHDDADEDFRSCPESTCDREVKKGCAVLNPFVWPYSGSNFFDASEIENKESFRGGIDVPRCGNERRYGDAHGVPLDQVDTAHDALAINQTQDKFIREPDHEVMTC